MPIAALDASAPEAVLDFLTRQSATRNHTYWAWKYQIGRAAGRGFYAHDGNGAVVGFIGLLPTTLWAGPRGERPVRASWFVDWASGTGGVGAGLGLLRQAQRTVDVLVTLKGSLDTRDILPRLKWQRIDAPGHWILPSSARALAARAEKGRPALLRLPLRLASRLGPLWFRVSRPPAGAFALREVSRFPESYDAVWTERRQEFAPLFDRSSAQLNFKFADYPGEGYRCFLVLDGGDVCGHLVLRTDQRRGERRGRIVDLLWARGRAGLLEWLVREAVWQLQDAGVDTIDCFASVPDLERVLAATRFSRRRGVPIFWDRLPEGVGAPDTWYVTLADCDEADR